MKNKNFGRKRQAIYILSNRKSTRIIKTLMDFFFFIKVKIKMVCFSVPSNWGAGELKCRRHFFAAMIQRDPDKLSIIGRRMAATHGQKEKTTVSHGKHIRNEWKLKFPLAFT